MDSHGTEAGLCVYGIAHSGEELAIAAPGIDGRPVRVIEGGPLAALVSPAPAGVVRGSRKNLLAHTNVLQEAGAECTVLPMRFGVVMPDEDAVRNELLGGHERELLAQLQSLGGLVELDVKVVCPEEVLLRTILAERPDLQALSVRLRGRSPDATYYERIRLGELVASAAAQKRQEFTQLVLDRIEPLAVRAHGGEPAHEQMLVNVAFLVERDRLDELDAAVNSVNDELPPGLRLSYVGPLPPFRFVDAEIDSGTAAWA
jgi:Gas vesicle synthesis protein GvpL/GvpF